MQTNHLIIKIRLISTLCALALLAAACSSYTPHGVAPVTGFDPARYAGKWYEIARFDYFFERNLDHVTADYAPNPDGSIAITNRGYDTSAKKWREAHAGAKFLGDPHTAALKVTFLWPFSGGYNVFALDPHYNWALVAGPNRDYLWILARKPQLDLELKRQLIAKAQAAGFATDRLLFVKQD